MIFSVGNIPSQHRNKIVTAVWRLLALLPIRPKRASKKNVDDEKQSALEIVQLVINKIVVEEVERLWKEGMEITCPDGKVRIGHPVIVGWIGDYPEYCKLFTTSYMSCPICIAPSDKMDAHSSSPCTHREVNAELLRSTVKRYKDAMEAKGSHTRNDPIRKAAQAEVEDIEEWAKVQRIRLVDNLLLRAPETSYRTLWKPDLLHTMDLGLIKHSLEWMFNMLDEHGKLKQSDNTLSDLYDVTWTAVTPHPAIKVPKKKYRSVKQWSGKEYRIAASIMQSVLEATVLPYPAFEDDKEISLEQSLDCISNLLNFYLMARYMSHTFPSDATFDNEYRAKWDGIRSPDPNDTISFLQHYLAGFHNTKEAFLKYRATAGIKKKAELYAKGEFPDLSEEEKKKMTAAELRKRNEEKAACKLAHMLEHAHYNMPKVHMVSHWGETIPETGSLPQHSTSIVELNHQPLNLAYDRSNKVDAMDQVVRFAAHKDAMSVRVANLLWLLKDPDLVDEETAKDICHWMNIFGSRKARLQAARNNRARMKTRVTRDKIAREEKIKRDRERLAESYRAIRRNYGFNDETFFDEDEQDSDDPEQFGDGGEEDDGGSSGSYVLKDASRFDAPGRILINRILTYTPTGCGKDTTATIHSLETVKDIEDLFGIEGLTAALLETLKKEPAYTPGSKEVIGEYDASPFCALRIRRPEFQSATQLD